MLMTLALRGHRLRSSRHTVLASGETEIPFSIEQRGCRELNGANGLRNRWSMPKAGARSIESQVRTVSPLEEAGFEPSVPRNAPGVVGCRFSSAPAHLSSRDGSGRKPFAHM